MSIIGEYKKLHGLSIAFLVIAILLVLFIIISMTFLGMFLSELGLWFSWIPLIMIIISIPFLIQYSYEHPGWDFFILLISSLLNLISYIRLMIPFIQVILVNQKFKDKMHEYLGESYLDYVDPTIKSRFFKRVNFKLGQYFAGIHNKRINKNVQIEKDILYRKIKDIELKLDIYYPVKEGIYPTILFIHGGGWIGGSKDMILSIRLLKRLAYMGYTIFSIDYRLASNPTFNTLRKIPHDNPTIREMVSDIRSAIIFVRQNTSNYFGDTNNLFLFGKSAGAHLALLTAFSCSEEFYEMEGIKCDLMPNDITGVIAFYPITDIRELYKFYDRRARILKQSIYRGTGGTYEETQNLFEIFSPINYINVKNKDSIPPVFLAAGKFDMLVDVYQSEELFEELQKNNIQSVFLELPWANHSFDFVINGPGGQLTFQYMTQFIVWAITKRRRNE